MTIDTNHSRRIVAYLRAVMPYDAIRVGPFAVLFDPDSDNRYRNYAIPDDGAEPSPDDVQGLIAAFESRGRLPRFEYVPDLAPAVLPALSSAGFKAEGFLPLMVCNKTAFRSPAPAHGAALALVTSDSDLEAAARVQNEAYDSPEPTKADFDRLRRIVERGGAVALARDTASGEAAGSGLYTAPLHSVTEIAAIGVREKFRRRGIAAAVTGLLTGDALARGVETALLMAVSETEAEIYKKTGFELCGTILHIARE